jgi:cytochrome c553
MKTLQNLVMLSVVSAFSLSANAGGNASAGEKIATEKCQACHGADGNSKDPQYPRLAGQHANYLERALSEYQGGGRKNPIMSGFAAGLSKQDVKDVAAWFASQDGLTSPIEPRTVQR